MNRLLLAGATGSSMTLTVHDHEGRERKRKLTRVPRGSFSAEDGEVLRLLEGNIGYADLRRLTVAEVDGMFERFPSAHPGSKRQTALPGQDGDDDRRAGDQPIRAHRAVLRGGERHDVHRQPDDGHQWRRHDLDPRVTSSSPSAVTTSATPTAVNSSAWDSFPTLRSGRRSRGSKGRDEVLERARKFLSETRGGA